MPITVDLSLVDDHVHPIVSNMGCQGFVATSASTTWQIQNVQVKCDLVKFDSGLNESYIKLLAEGKQLTLNYNTFISQYSDN